MTGRLSFGWCAALGLAAASLLGSSSAQAAVLAADSFITGANPAAGEYTAGDLVPQSPTVSTFSGPWADGLTTTTPGTFDVTASGLTWDGFNATGGAVQYQYSTSLANVQAAVRSFANPVTYNDGTFYMTGLMSFDGNFSTAVTSTALTGLLNAEEGDPAVSLLVGTQWGFQGNGAGGVNAVLRVRGTSGTTTTATVAPNISPGTHLFVMKVEVDYTGTNSNDRVTVWLDPAVGTPQGIVAPTFTGVYGNWLDPTVSDRVVDSVVFRATDVGADAAVVCDEVRLAESWNEVMPVTADTAYLRQGVDGYSHVGAGIRQSGGPYGTNDELLVGGVSSTAVNNGRSVLAFGTEAIPDDVVVTGVELTFTVKRVVGTITGPIELHATNPAAPMDEAVVNWTVVNPTLNWTQGGGDPESTVLGSITSPTAAGQVVTFGSTPGLLAAVQAALDGDESLELVLMAPSAEDTIGQKFVGFYSDDASDLYMRPLLKITYAPVPEPSVWALLLGIAPALLFRRRK